MTKEVFTLSEISNVINREACDALSICDFNSDKETASACGSSVLAVRLMLKFAELAAKKREKKRYGNH